MQALHVRFDLIASLFFSLDDLCGEPKIFLYDPKVLELSLVLLNVDYLLNRCSDVKDLHLLPEFEVIFVQDREIQDVMGEVVDELH